jgi:hypothetical protein
VEREHCTKKENECGVMILNKLFYFNFILSQQTRPWNKKNVLKDGLCVTQPTRLFYILYFKKGRGREGSKQQESGLKKRTPGTRL